MRFLQHDKIVLKLIFEIEIEIAIEVEVAFSHWNLKTVMNHLSVFTTFVLRTPLLPIRFYTSLFDNYSRAKVFNTLENQYVKNAIALASPELYNELEKYKLNPHSFSEEKAKNLEISLIKYLARISARATPFGLFAGCTTGVFTTETLVELQPITNYTTHTQFDMQFWTHWLQELGKEEAVRQHLIYYPNSAMYKIGDFFRYIEYRFVNKRREHTIAAIRNNQFVERIHAVSTTGKTRQELVKSIIDDASEQEEAMAFINDLIDNQFLVSNLEPTVTGNEEIGRVIGVLESIKELSSKVTLLKELKLDLDSMQNKIVTQQTISQHIQEKVKQLDVVFEEKYLLQTDLYTKTHSATLNTNIAKKLKQAILFLEKIREISTNSNLENFKKAFLNRYETKEMPLAVVLDSEIGIGYLQNMRMDDSHPILDQFPISNSRKKTTTQESWSKLSYLLEEKLNLCATNQEPVLHLKETDFKDFNSKNHTIPATFSAMIEVFQEADKEIIALESLGNNSAVKLIGRFCNGAQTIHELAKEIVAKETHLHSNAILAEIAHIPESRTGNILRRPILRDYEITYLSNSVLPKENQIDIEDLTVSVQNNSVILKSKRLNKIIIPCLSNAHNYSSNALPIYHFLCDLQGQNVHPIYGFDWGILKQHYNDFPRVMYKDVILSKAKWYVYFDAIQQIAFGADFTIWKTKKKMPRYVTIVKGDNTLLLDLESEICFDIMQKSAKLSGKVILEEFLFTNESVVKDKEGNSFANQFVVSFHRE